MRTPWMKRREMSGLYDIKKTKADRERLRRGKMAIYKKANNEFFDEHEVGKAYQIYALICEKRGGNEKYYTHNSHPERGWVPSAETVVSINLSPCFFF